MAPVLTLHQGENTREFVDKHSAAFRPRRRRGALMTSLYRITGEKSPDLGRRTFWTMHEEEAEWLADWEGTCDLSASQLYRAEVAVDDNGLGEFSLAKYLPRIRDRSVDANDVSELVDAQVGGGPRWVQLTDENEPESPVAPRSSLIVDQDPLVSLT